MLGSLSEITAEEWLYGLLGFGLFIWLMSAVLRPRDLEWEREASRKYRALNMRIGKIARRKLDN